MKKTSCFVSILLFFALALCGCGGKGGGSMTVHVYAPDGAPAIGLAKMISDGVEDTAFHIVQPTQIAERVANGDADIAILPTNAAALLAHRGIGIKMLGVTNFGSLYVVGKGDAQTLGDLVGEVVYSIGEGNVPDLVFRALLAEAGMESQAGTSAKEGVVTLAYVADGTAFTAGLAAGTYKYGVVSEPAATAATKKVAGAHKCMDIQALWRTAYGTSVGFPQAALVVDADFYASHTAYVQDFVRTYTATVHWAESEPAAALDALKKAGSAAVPMLNEVIAKGCHLGFTAAKSAQSELEDFYAAIDDVVKKPATPIGSLPKPDFYLDVLAA